MYLVQDMTSFKGDQWQMIKNNLIVFRGSFKELLRYAVLAGFELGDFERAISAIVHNEHNTLEFDRHKKLLSTSYSSVAKSRKTG